MCHESLAEYFGNKTKASPVLSFDGHVKYIARRFSDLSCQRLCGIRTRLRVVIPALVVFVLQVQY